jgi:hypothetical protein
MKKLIIIIITCLVTFSCNNSSGSGTKAIPAASKTATSSNDTKAGYGTFSFTSNGKQRIFTTWHSFVLMHKDKWNNPDSLMLEDGGPSNAGFDFRINKEGTTEFKTGYSNELAPHLEFSFFDTTGISYIRDGMIVKVSYLSGDKLTGTFSGNFIKEKSQIKENASGSVPQVIKVTDGKFDLHQ